MTASIRPTQHTRELLAELLEGELAEQRHPGDSLDEAFAQHPEKCSTGADYPDWTPGGTR